MNQLKTLIIILIFGSFSVFAQRTKIELGIEGGPSIAFMQVRNNPSFNYYNPRILGSGAFAFEYHFSNLIYLRSALGYEVKGYQRPYQIYANGTDLGIATTYFQFDYVTLPILIRLNFGKKIRFFLNAGPYMSYLTAKKAHISEYEQYSGSALSGSVRDYNRFDFGFSGGLGIGIPINENWSVSLEARNNFGLLPLKTDNDGKIFTNSSNLLAGINYRLKPTDPERKSRLNKNSFSQENRITLGIEGGPNISTFLENKPSINNDQSNSAIQAEFSGSAGLTFQWNSRKHFSLRTGVTFQQNEYSFTTGSSSNVTLIGSYGKGTHRFDYLTLPVLARFTYGQKAHFFFNVGLYAGIPTRQTEKIEGTAYSPYSGGSTSPYVHTSNYVPDYNHTIDFGAVGGIGIGIPVMNHWEFSVEMRDNLGLVNVLAENYYKRTMRTNTLSVLIGVSYKLGFRDK